MTWGGSSLSVPAGWLRALVVPLVILAWLAVAVVAAWLLGHIAHTLLVVVLSVVLAFAFTPLANRLSRWMPRPLALGVAYLLGVGVVLAFGVYVVATTAAQVSSLVANLPDYLGQTQSLEGRAESALQPFGVAPGSLADLQQQILVGAQATGTEVARASLGRVADVLGTVIDVVLIFILSAAALGVAVVHFQEVFRPLLVLVYFVVVHVIEGDVVGPRIMGKAVGIHPATGLIALVAGTELFGVWGALFAAPLAGLLQAIVTAAWLEFRGGNPQEILQAMTDEATQQVERRTGVA